MSDEKKPGQAEELAQCAHCNIWIRMDRMDAHVLKAHPANAAPRKSFTNYTAKIASKFPPRHAPAPTRPLVVPAGTLRLASRDGKRAGAGVCAECGREQAQLWHYDESSHGPVEICSECRTKVFERSFGAA